MAEGCAFICPVFPLLQQSRLLLQHNAPQRKQHFRISLENWSIRSQGRNRGGVVWPSTSSSTKCRQQPQRNPSSSAYAVSTPSRAGFSLQSTPPLHLPLPACAEVHPWRRPIVLQGIEPVSQDASAGPVGTSELAMQPSAQLVMQGAEVLLPLDFGLEELHSAAEHLAAQTPFQVVLPRLLDASQPATCACVCSCICACVCIPLLQVESGHASGLSVMSRSIESNENGV